MSITLPIDQYSAQISNLLKQQRLLITASPGSGKTTRLPLMLKQHVPGKILVLEPRRLAAKWASEFIAQGLSQKVGEEVGYVFRHERALTEKTQIIFLTEGTFAKWWGHNPELDGIDAVILDEFHERHEQTDVAMGLVTLTQQKRPELKVILMSATLEASLIEKFWGKNFAHFDVHIPPHPLSIEFLPRGTELANRPLEKKILWALQNYTPPADTLVFLPGKKEISQTDELLRATKLADTFDILWLHGEMDRGEQGQVMAPSAKRKIILATNIAESSITIPRVSTVIDGGLARQMKFNPWSGQGELSTVKISQSSAIQRAGRAARTGAGTCIRLYTELDYQERPKADIPEIHRTDLCSIILLLKHHKIDLATFPWPEPPAEKNIHLAEQLLQQMDCFSPSKDLTTIGQDCAISPLPPRAARIIYEGQKELTQQAYEVLVNYIAVWWEAPHYRNKLKAQLVKQKARGTQTHWERALITGFPDHVAKKRGQDFITVSGETLKASRGLTDLDPRHEWWVVLDVHSLTKEATRVEAIEFDWIKDRVYIETSTEWNADKNTYEQIVLQKLGSLTLERKVSSTQALAENQLEAAVKNAMEEFKLSLTYKRLQLWQAHLVSEKPLSDFEWELFAQEFRLDLTNWNEDIKHKLLTNLKQEIQLYLDPQFEHNLDKLCPTKLELSQYRTVDVHYDEQMPWIETFIQDFFGRSTTPSILNGKLPLSLKLTGPHRRPLQQTNDLAGFWQRTYKELLAEMRREYPRHHWPDHPASALPILHKKNLPQG